MPQRRQGIFWCLTIPHASFTPYLPPSCAWIKGQLETGEAGYLHYQLIVGFKQKTSLAQVRQCFGPFHAELSRSELAEAYVWKEDTRVAGTQFEFGAKPMRLNAKPDWDAVWSAAKSGNLEIVPAGVRIRSYHALRTIGSDYAKCLGMERSVYVYWGKTGTGKSRTAWEEGSLESYSKDPRSKFWCGYQTEENVIIDEFRGGIDISHLLRWTDRYPVRVEVKGSSRPLCARKIWITSNLHPRDWYPELDSETLSALLRRLTVTEFH